MTTATFAAAPTNATAVDFRAWGSGVSTALAAAGLVKTADTGQINWTTVTQPVANVQQGYEVWRFSDSLHATAPIYIRVGFGGGSTPAHPAMWLSCGKGTDGAGTLTGVLTAATMGDCKLNSATVSTWYVSSGDGSMLVISPAPAWYNTTTGALWAVERSRNAAGAATGTGLVQVTRNGNQAPTIYVRNYATATGLTPLAWPAAIPADTTTSTSIIGAGSKAYLFPAVVADGQGNIWQPRCILTYPAPDIGLLAGISVAGFGTYLALGPVGHKMDAAVGANGQAAMAWY